MENLCLLDANPLLRYLLNDIPMMADETEKRINEGAFTLPEVLAEIIYVLQKVYKMERPFICDCIRTIIRSVKIEHQNIIQYALDLFQSHSLDFVDCILISYNHLENVTVFSFDKELNNKLK